jgi:endonuclease/exonuclease/phosphatase family metal-dependent hydrolase
MRPTAHRLIGAIVACVVLLALYAAPARAQVSSPSPADKATGVASTTALSWRADPSANRYDVYLGTSNPPAVAARNLSTTSYQPVTLSASTTYYWRVDSKGPRGYAATGVVWSFTTAAPPPPPPSAPSGASPAPGSTGVATSVTLSWSASANATSYDVAFGTSSPPPVVSTGQTATTFKPSGGLAYAQTYYWRVTAKGAGGTTAGAVWSFTTIQPPASTARDRLRLMTWNIQSTLDASGTPAIDAQVALMADSKADVIALQEVSITPDYGDLTVLYKSKLEAATGVPWYQLWAPDPRASTYTAEGNILLSRIPIFTSATAQFDTVPDDPAWTDTKRSAGAITLVVNNVQVTVLTTHMPVDPTQRQKTLDLFQSWASTFPTPRLIGADFNMIPGDSVYTDMAGTFTDAWTVIAGPTEYGFTKDVRNVAPYQPGRIDYWFEEPADTHARVTEMWVVKTTRSDHHPVVVDVDVK